ncbi:MAG: hypothetical protein OHK0011_19030 [Turneriella sp.]
MYYLKLLGGGVLGKVGWFFFALGMVFFWAFQVPMSFKELVLFSLPHDTAAGVVTETVATNIVDNDQVVFRVSFRYLVAEQELTGSAYIHYKPDPAGTVTVEYLTSYPEISRIEGGSYSPLGISGLWVMVFPFLSLLPFLIKLPGNLRHLRLMRRGVVADARLERSEDTKIRIDNKPLMRLRFAFTDQQGRQHRIVFRTSNTQRVTDEQREKVLYLADKPSVSCLVDRLPGKVSVQPDGALRFNAQLHWSDYLPLLLILLGLLPAIFF